MKAARAIIDWLPASQGGRSKPPIGVGRPIYATVVHFVDEPWPPEVSWSLAVEKVEQSNSEYHWIANIHFVVQEAPHESLYEGRGFELYEGRQIVAHGIISGNQ
jgi:hypothetical protein